MGLLVVVVLGVILRWVGWVFLTREIMAETQTLPETRVAVAVVLILPVQTPHRRPLAVRVVMVCLRLLTARLQFVGVAAAAVAVPLGVRVVQAAVETERLVLLMHKTGVSTLAVAVVVETQFLAVSLGSAAGVL
jgi:hypothetical protein